MERVGEVFTIRQKSVDKTVCSGFGDCGLARGVEVVPQAEDSQAVKTGCESVGLEVDDFSRSRVTVTCRQKKASGCGSFEAGRLIG